MKPLLREKVRRLRSKGSTYSEIARAINGAVSRSTISLWCRNVRLPESYPGKLSRIAKESREKARKVLDERATEERRLFAASVSRNNTKLLRLIKDDPDVQKIALTMLYLGEGAKWKGHRGLMLGSSDPSIVCLYVQLLKLVYAIPKEKLRVSVLYRADQDFNKLRRFWSKTLSIPSRQFYKSKPDPRTVGKPTRNKNYRGVCVITCGGTEKQLELELLSNLIKESLGPIA